MGATSGEPVQAGGAGAEPGLLEAPAALDREGAPAFWHRVQDSLRGAPGGLELDLAPVRRFDSSGLAVLVGALSLARSLGRPLVFRGASPEIESFFSLVSLERLTRPSRPDRRRFDLVGRAGDLALPGVRALRCWGLVCVETFWGIVVRPFRGERIRWDRVVREIDAVGAGAVPIVTLIGFLIGLILVMQTAPNLREFGVDLYVADMVGVSVTREIGPLMAAILTAARSGSSIAAEIGTMVVSEEVDALKQMGIHPVRFLVLPKVVALAISVPCLGVLFSIAAILGGLLFGTAVLGLPWGAYVEHTQSAIKQSDILEGAFKCAVFGALVGQVGCALGLGVQGGAVGVGKATTFAVVLSIFLIILFDAFFVGLFRLV